MEKGSPPAWIRPSLLGGLTLLFILLGQSRLGTLPPPGKFFNPFSGFWRNAEAGGRSDRELRLRGLKDPVWVVFDKRGVPHIFAQNEKDLYFAQGYVTARDRLWQMEIQVQAAAGRLAEVLGPPLVERDRFQRRLGMRLAAEKSLELMKKDQEAWDAVEAYAAGVNAHVLSLGYARFPLEYKLLDYSPERWTPLKTALLVKNMQWTLSGGGDDLPMTNTRAKFGPDFIAKFFPAHISGIAPVIPAGTPWMHSPDTTVTTPDRPADAIRTDSGKAGPVPVIPVNRPDAGNGSNNFVLAARRTNTGFPILANDPHMDLGLPSLWYENQLAAPGINAYGVSLPGGPSLIIGFNKKIAWGLTNGHDDVFDWYSVHFRDSTLSEYMHGGRWVATGKVVEAIRVRGGGIVLDTVVYTRHGPLVVRSQERPMNRNSPAQHVLRWLALDASDELGAFVRIAKAGNHAEFTAALRPFHCPSQNFAFADAAGNIAMEHQGLFPRKWPGQGRFILDGKEPGQDWQGWIPPSENPRSRNPEQGWLASANQDPTDSTYPHYLGSSFFNGERTERLQALVSRADSVSPEKAFSMLLDDYDLQAERILPTLLGRMNRAGLSSPDSAALRQLAGWDYRHRPGPAAPLLFDHWWRTLHRSIWQDEFGGDTLHYQWPSRSRTLRLILEEPDADWYDDIQTPSRENLTTLVNRAFREGMAAYLRSGSAPRNGGDGTAYRPVHIRHLARIDAFSRLDVAAGGCADCVNAQKTSHGPSWRMVVALGKEPRGYGIYPGGQSGNPGSRHYDDFVDDWARGESYPLTFFADLQSSGADAAGRLLLKGK